MMQIHSVRNCSNHVTRKLNKTVEDEGERDRGRKAKRNHFCCNLKKKRIIRTPLWLPTMPQSWISWYVLLILSSKPRVGTCSEVTICSRNLVNSSPSISSPFALTTLSKSSLWSTEYASSPVIAIGFVYVLLFVFLDSNLGVLMNFVVYDWDLFDSP